MGLSKERDVFNRGKQEEYYNRINEIIYKDRGWLRYFKQIKIIFNPKNIKRTIPELEKELEISEFSDVVCDKKYLLNEAVIGRMNEDAQNKFNNNKEKYGNKETTFRLPNDYVDV